MNTASWIVLLMFAAGISGYIGFLAGREGAESRAAATIADLRVSLRRSTEKSDR